jgi:hypothetical protein
MYINPKASHFDPCRKSNKIILDGFKKQFQQRKSIKGSIYIDIRAKDVKFSKY